MSEHSVQGISNFRRRLHADKVSDKASDKERKINPTPQFEHVQTSEPGILPGGIGAWFGKPLPIRTFGSGRQDAALYGSQDGCRYSRKPTPNTYAAASPRRSGAERGSVTSLPFRPMHASGDIAARWCVFSVVAARAPERGLQSAGVLVSEGGFGIFAGASVRCSRSCGMNPAPLPRSWLRR